MRNHSIGWAANRLLAKQRREARSRIAAQVFGIFLSIVCLWAVWHIGCDFIDHIAPAADMGAW